MLVKDCSSGNYYANDRVTLGQLADEFKLVLMPNYLSNPFATYDVYRRNNQGKPYRWLEGCTLGQLMVDIKCEYNVMELSV